MLRLLFLLLFSSTVFATTQPALESTTLRLDDGTSHEVYLLGSRSHPYLALMDGRLLLEEQGVYYVAVSTNGGLPERTDTVFGYAAGYQPGAVVPDDIAYAVSAQAAAPVRLAYRYGGGAYEQPVVIVRVEFSDQQFEYSDAEISQRMFGSADSVSAYYLENSYGNYRIVPASDTSATHGDGVVRMTLNSAHPDFGSSYGSASSQLVRSAMAVLGNYLNLSAYDRNGDQWLDPSELGVVVLVAGFEQAFASSATTHPRVWAHKSSVSSTEVGGMWLSEYAMFGEQHEQHLATVGIMAHELGHLLLDLPDLYDSIGVGSGIGRWGLMSYGTWNSGGGNAGDKPAHLVAWAKEFVGFASAFGEKSGGFSLDAVAADDDFVRLDVDPYRHGKRYLIENRQRSGFDDGIPGVGVLITEIDDWHGFGPLASLTGAESDLLIEPVDTSGGSGVSLAGGTLISSADSLSLAGGKIVVTGVRSGSVASMNIANNVTLTGRAVGYDDVPPNGTWGNYGEPGIVVVETEVNPYLKTVDGMDFFAHGAGVVEITLYKSLTRYSGEDRLYREEFKVTQGWNRLLFSTKVSLDVATVFVQVVSTPSASHAPFVVDIQGMVSGRTKAKLRTEYPFSDVEFDVSAKMLITTSEVATERAPVTETSSKSSGGGAFIWGLLIVFLVRKRIY